MFSCMYVCVLLFICTGEEINENIHFEYMSVWFTLPYMCIMLCGCGSESRM